MSRAALHPGQTVLLSHADTAHPHDWSRGTVLWADPRDVLVDIDGTREVVPAGDVVHAGSPAEIDGHLRGCLARVETAAAHVEALERELEWWRRELARRLGEVNAPARLLTPPHRLEGAADTHAETP